jgi:hypothetical protein
MAVALPPEIVFTETDDRIHYRMPRPDFGLGRFAGCFPIGCGCIPAVMGGAFIAFAVTILMHDAPWEVILIGSLMLLIPLAFLLAGLALIFYGGWMLAGHQEIELTASHVRAAMRLGPLRWSGRRSRGALKQFTVVKGDQGGVPQPGKNLLQAECEGSKPLRLAVAYPEQWLHALAKDLKRACRALPAEAPGEAVGVAEESTSPHDIRSRTERPVNSRVVLEEEADGVRLVVLPPGIWQGSNKFFVLWTFLWWAFLVPFTAIFGTAAVRGDVHNEHGEPVSATCSLLFLVPFWLVAVGFLAAIVFRGRFRTVLTVADGRLAVVQTGLLGPRRWQWSREEIADVLAVCDRRSRVGEGKKNPYYPWLIDLRVVPRDGADVNLISYREGDSRKADLEWVATVLRRALRLEAINGFVR